MDSKNIEDIYKLTSGQQAMLSYALQAPEASISVEQVTRLQKNLDVEKYICAWQKVVARHPALRTAFVWENFDEPRQVVSRQVELPVDRLDWSSLSPDEQAQQLDAFLEADSRRGLPLTRAPLMRLTLIRLDDTTTNVIWSYHHILVDGWSAALITQEIQFWYTALIKGEPADLPKPRPFRDYVAWLRGQEWSVAEAFWREKLQGITSATALGIDRAAGSLPRLEAAFRRETLTLPADVSQVVKTFAREQHLTVNMLVQAAWVLLLSRYSDEEDIVFGVIDHGRPASLSGFESMVGLFINALPMRVSAPANSTALAWLSTLQAELTEQRRYNYCSLAQIQSWNNIRRDRPLFDYLLVDQSTPGSSSGEAIDEGYRLIEVTGYPLTVSLSWAGTMVLHAVYDPERFADGAVTRMLEHFQTLLHRLVTHPQLPLSDISILSDVERQQLLVEWNATAAEYPSDRCLHELIEAQAARTPDAIALIFVGQRLTYHELNQRANQLAHHLRALGVQTGALVGICVERSIEMMVGLLGILKAGAAYVPLDPSYPPERLAFMLEDARMPVLVTQQWLTLSLPEHSPRLVCLDADWGTIGRQHVENPTGAASPASLAYVIYTSGSTGRPKGVMVGHRNVVNFFAAMDRCLGDHTPGVWLAVTSISFDISVLELLWTLTRGFQVVVQGEHLATGALGSTTDAADRPIDFSLFYFASDDRVATADKYKLLIEGAKFADQHGFSAVWTPERHFDAFGGLYPSPSVTSAALSTITQHIQLRAGSVVLPLHNPIRVAEEWAMIDNLSHGRVGISFASGWHADDFVLAPEHYADRKAVMQQEIETVRALWRGEAVARRNGVGSLLDVQILPRPIQPELPIWVTAAGSPDTFRLAGEIGANVLTHLLGQSVEELAEKIAVYRAAWQQHGHAPGAGQVTLMLHTYIGKDVAAVREKVRQPFTDYLRSSVGLMKNFARGRGLDMDSQQFGEEDMAALLAHAFDRYFETSGLFGTPEMCLQMVERLKGIGVDEVGCLIDFGVDFASVMAGLDYLDQVRQQSRRRRRVVADDPLPIQLDRQRVTHMQCTPSLAGALTLDQGALAALRPLRRLLLGGEALPAGLAEQFRVLVSGEVMNMYGPTETTIWSTTHRLGGEAGAVPIGRPIANTTVYVLDRQLEPVPVGVAGELYIGGAGVVAGYLRRPELTAERFVPNPFAADTESGGETDTQSSVLSPQSSLRLYRTGDLARYQPDGTITFLGRLDHQIKLRGFRIELGEIEAVLRQHAQVQEALVVARERANEPGERTLVAYVVTAGEQELSSSELRHFLQEQLPAYMLPAGFVFLSELPRLPNGKVDRSALPGTDAIQPIHAATLVAPRTPVEEVLAEMWANLLGLERVGILDNFFDLGGHSLKAAQLIIRIRDTFQVNLPVRSLFEATTVETVARLLVAHEAKPGQTEKIASAIKRLKSVSPEDRLKMLEQKRKAREKV